MGLPSSLTPPAHPTIKHANHGSLPAHDTSPPPYQPRAQDRSSVELEEFLVRFESQPAGTDEMLARKEKKKIRQVIWLIFWYSFVAMIVLVPAFIMVATVIGKKGMPSMTESPPTFGNTTSSTISPVASTGITTQTVTVTGLLPAIGPITMTTSTTFSTATVAETRTSSAQTHAVAPTHISVPTLAIASAAGLSLDNVWPTACPECN